jgi:hypothetical protein
MKIYLILEILKFLLTQILQNLQIKSINLQIIIIKTIKLIVMIDKLATVANAKMNSR